MTPMRRASIPNTLTLARLLLAPLFFLALTPAPVGPLSRGLHASDRFPLILAAALFILAAVTDALDGFLARRWNVVSRFGRVMDPFADKILVLGAFLLLAGPAFTRDAASLSAVTPWVCIGLLARELLVTSLRALLESEGADASAQLTGKLKMVLQSVSIPAILLLLAVDPAAPAPWTLWTIRVVVWTTTLVTIVSGLPYVITAFRPKEPARA